MKRKRRYLLFQVKTDNPLDAIAARKLGDATVLESLGEQGNSRAEYRLKYFNEKTQQMLVQCALESQEEVLAAFVLKRFFEGCDVKLSLLKVYGTLHKALPAFPGVKPGADRHSKS